MFISDIAGPVEGAGVDAAGRALLLDAARTERDAAYEAARETLASKRYARLVVQLTSMAETRGWLPQPPDPLSVLMLPVGEASQAVLSKAHAKVLKKGRRLETLSLDERHDLRIRIKKLRYAVDFLQGLYETEQRKVFRTHLKQLQTTFGHLNDVAVAERLVAAILHNRAGSGDHGSRLHLAAGAVLGWHARGLRDGEADLLEDWQTFAAIKPFWPKR